MYNYKCAFDSLSQMTFILDQFNVFAKSFCIAIKVLLAIKLEAFILFCFHFMSKVKTLTFIFSHDHKFLG